MSLGNAFRWQIEKSLSREWKIYFRHIDTEVWQFLPNRFNVCMCCKRCVCQPHQRRRASPCCAFLFISKREKNEKHVHPHLHNVILFAWHWRYCVRKPFFNAECFTERLKELLLLVLGNGMHCRQQTGFQPNQFIMPRTTVASWGFGSV